jgi:hypothetical protein
MGKKQSRASSRALEEEGTASLRGACLIEKWMDKKANTKVGSQRLQYLTELERKPQHDHGGPTGPYKMFATYNFFFFFLNILDLYPGWRIFKYSSTESIIYVYLCVSTHLYKNDDIYIYIYIYIYNKREV